MKEFRMILKFINFHYVSLRHDFIQQVSLRKTKVNISKKGNQGEMFVSDSLPFQKEVRYERNC